MEIFDKFDRVVYRGQTLTNILRRTKLIKGILNQIGVYFDYVVKDGERPDTIAYDYYGDSNFTWLVYICNNIYDPYYQWPLNNEQMYNYLTRKYGDYNQTKVDIKWYIHPQKSFGVSQQTIDSWTQEQRIGWVPQTIFEFEDQMNEKKRYIKLISNRYLTQILREVDQLFS